MHHNNILIFFKSFRKIFGSRSGSEHFLLDRSQGSGSRIGIGNFSWIGIGIGIGNYYFLDRNRGSGSGKKNFGSWIGIAIRNFSDLPNSDCKLLYHESPAHNFDDSLLFSLICSMTEISYFCLQSSIWPGIGTYMQILVVYVIYVNYVI